MTNQYRYLSLSLCLTLPAIGCDLPAKNVGETADPMLAEGPQEEPLPQEDEPQDPPVDPQDPPQDPPVDPPVDPQDPQDPQPVEPPSDQATIIAKVAGTLAVDDTWLFVGAHDGVWRVLKSGGEPEPVVTENAEPTVGAQLLALDDTHVYWSGSSASESSYSLMRAPKLGGAPTLVTDAIGPNYADPVAIAVDDEFVYLSQPDLLNSPPNGAVSRVPKAGGAVQVLAQDFAYSMAISDSSIYWGRLRNDDGGDLVRADKDGLNSEVIYSELGLIIDVAVSGDRVFWHAMDADQSIVRTAVEGGPTTTLLTESGPSYYFGTPVATADALYWLNGGGADSGGVVSVDLAGQFSQLVTAPASSSYSGWGGTYGTRIAADESAIYWAYEGAQGGVPRIYRIAR